MAETSKERVQRKVAALLVGRTVIEVEKKPTAEGTQGRLEKETRLMKKEVKARRAPDYIPLPVADILSPEEVVELQSEHPEITKKWAKAYRKLKGGEFPN